MNRLKKEHTAMLEERIRAVMQEYRAAGMAVSLINGEGETLYEEMFGTKDPSTGAPVSGDTLFGLASVTKSFTALCIMRMMQDGLLSTDDPVSAYLPEFDDRGGRIRIRHLLTHSAGFLPLHRTTIGEVAGEYGLSLQEDPAYSVELAEKGAETVIRRMNAFTEFIGEPGEYCSYCNDGYGLLSEIIRRHGECRTYPEYLNRHVLEPLGMTRSTCEFLAPAEDPDAAVLCRTVNGIRTEDRDYTDNAFALHGGGALKSTLNDMKKYLRMYLNDGAGIVFPHLIHTMCTPRVSFTGDSYYGYGLYMENTDHQLRVKHSGSLPGVSSAIAFSPDTGTGAVILCNTSDVPVSGIADALLDISCGRIPFAEKTYTEISWSDETVRDACGSYHTDEEDEEDIILAEENGKPVLISGNTRRTPVMTGRYRAVLPSPYSTGTLELIHRNGVITAMKYGSRILKKSR